MRTQTRPPIIFLDIDGVLQPHTASDRFTHDLKALRDRFTHELDPGYATLDPYDIGAVHHDWHPEAVGHLKQLCELTGARIVVSSNWREGRTRERLLLLFRLQGLDELIDDVTPSLPLSPRDEEIAAWLAVHPEVDRFVILDDYFVDRLTNRFGGRFIYCKWHLGPEEYARALQVLALPAGDVPRHDVVEAEPFPW